jgi:putative hydrolase
MEMPGTCHAFYFRNFKVVPRRLGDLRIVCGIEANIMDYEGNIDVPEDIERRMDYIIASLHPNACIKPGTVEQNTNGILGAMDNPYVKIIGHPDDDRIPVDLERVVSAAVEKKVVLEVNNSSLAPGAARQGADKNIRTMLKLAKEQGAYIILGTDSHISYQVGRFDNALAVLEEVDFPEELVINFDPEKLPMVLNKDIEF